MIPVSNKWKEHIYSTEFIRWTQPEIVIEIIDVLARENATYTINNEAFYSHLSQLNDGYFDSDFRFGTLEDNLFILDGTKRAMYPNFHQTGQYGSSTEWLAGPDGYFEEPIKIICSYPITVTTIGRTLFFDTNIDSWPTDFDLEYSGQGIPIEKIQVRNHHGYTYISSKDISHYDKLEYTFYKMSLPFRRLRIVEDVPGTLVTFSRESIISLSLQQLVDIFSKEIIVGELDFSIENVAKELNILNPTGYEKFLQQRQPIRAYIYMIFPDDTRERVQLNEFKLTKWKTPKRSLITNFTARDNTDTLALNKYNIEAASIVQRNMYDLAKKVFMDAGIDKHLIDEELKNIYTTALLPVATHKELLRLIAQASLSVITMEHDGVIHLKYFSPLVPAKNDIKNAAFSNGWTNWSATGSALDTTRIYKGRQSAKLNNNGTVSQLITAVPSHIVYCRFYVWTDTPITGTSAGLYINDTLTSVNLVDANIFPQQWTAISVLVPITVASNNFAIRNYASPFNVHGLMWIDLTETYGEGNEPDILWCEANIRFFETAMNVPRRYSSMPVDNIDFTVLFDSPEIETRAPKKAVSVNVYSYSVDTTVTELYKGKRTINGTEEFPIVLRNPAQEVQITLTPASATLISQEVYAQTIFLKVFAQTEVEIIATGKAIIADKSLYRIDNKVEPSLVADAKEESIDNPLITDAVVAEDVVSYAIYWYNRKYLYNFDWRQNPALEVLDTVTIQDSFNQNNNVLITERNIDHRGILGGSSRGLA